MNNTDRIGTTMQRTVVEGYATAEGFTEVEATETVVLTGFVEIGKNLWATALVTATTGHPNGIGRSVRIHIDEVPSADVCPLHGATCKAWS